MDWQGDPRGHGFRMPAEWEPHEQCWMGWPVCNFATLHTHPSIHFFLSLPFSSVLIP